MYDLRSRVYLWSRARVTYARMELMFHLLVKDSYLLEVLGTKLTHKMAVVVFVCV